MNIYNDSNYSIPQPSNATFQSITTNDIFIPGATNGDVLFINNTEVTGLAIGPQNYLIQSSGSQPQWTNSLNVNTIETVDLKIPNTLPGDLFTVDSNSFFERVALGPTGSILMSQGNQYQWETYTNGKAFFINNRLQAEESKSFPNNQYVNIPLAFTTLFSFNTPTINLRRYKVTVSGRQQSIDSGEYLLNINGATFCSWNPRLDTDISRAFAYTSNTTGNTLIEFIGKGSVSLNTTIVQFNLLFEPFM